MTGRRRKQPPTPGERPWCEEATQRLEQVEQSLLFLTAAGMVCQMGSQDWYGWCVLTLAILATGAQAKDVSSPRGSRGHMEGEGVVPQETYHLEAYD